MSLLHSYFDQTRNGMCKVPGGDADTSIPFF